LRPAARRRHRQRSIVLRRIADHLALAVHRAVSGLAGYLRAPVTVEVVDHELGVVRAGANVPAEIDAPQPLPVERVRIDQHAPRDTRRRGVACVRRLPLQDDLVLAVAIEIADARVVGAVGDGGRRHARRQIDRPARWPIERHGEELLHRRAGREHERPPWGLLDAVRHGPYRVGVRLGDGGGRIQEVRRRRERLGVEAHGRARARGAVEIECDADGIGAQKAPADVHRRIARAHRNDTAIEPLHDVLGAGCRGRQRGEQAQGGSGDKRTNHWAPHDVSAESGWAGDRTIEGGLSEGLENNPMAIAPMAITQ
jgi:hypothetical protein